MISDVLANKDGWIIQTRIAFPRVDDDQFQTRPSTTPEVKKNTRIDNPARSTDA
jgi:hypothetical protein